MSSDAMASLRSLGVSIRLGQATLWNAYRSSFPRLYQFRSNTDKRIGRPARSLALLNEFPVNPILPANLSQRKACCVCSTESSARAEETVELFRSSSSSAGYYRDDNRGRQDAQPSGPLQRRLCQRSAPERFL